MRLNRQTAIFLDRDGTINVDTGYTHKIEDWEFLPGAIEALAAFKKAGWLLVVISNQSGIGRGYYTFSQLKELETWVNAQLMIHTAAIDAWYYCPHLPDAGCSCRKPAPGLILAAAHDLNINLSASWILGDKASDLQAGLTAGCHAGLITTHPDLIDIDKGTYHIWPGLKEAAKYIIGEKQNLTR